MHAHSFHEYLVEQVRVGERLCAVGVVCRVLVVSDVLRQVQRGLAGDGHVGHARVVLQEGTKVGEVRRMLILLMGWFDFLRLSMRPIRRFISRLYP